MKSPEFRGFLIFPSGTRVFRSVWKWAVCPFFCFWGRMRSAPDELSSLIERTVGPMGYELVGVELAGRAGHGRTLRVYIDKDEGITLDDCVAVSHQLSGVLDVEDPIPEQYELEVSSPGLDRPLFRPEHFERFAGERAHVKLMRAMDGRRNFEGVIKGVADGCVILNVDGQEVALAFDNIGTARLVPTF